MACKDNACLCRHIVISQAITFNDDTLAINLPAGAYENGEKYCIIIGQSIPEDTTIAAQVAITIGDDTTEYPLVNPNCTNVSACSIKTRMRYATRVFTNISDGVFKLLAPISCSCCSGCSSGGSLPLTSTAVQSTNTTGGEG